MDLAAYNVTSHMPCYGSYLYKFLFEINRHWQPVHLNILKIYVLRTQCQVIYIVSRAYRIDNGRSAPRERCSTSTLQNRPTCLKLYHNARTYWSLHFHLLDCMALCMLPWNICICIIILAAPCENVSWAYADSECQVQPAHPCSPIKTFTVRL